MTKKKDKRSARRENEEKDEKDDENGGGSPNNKAADDDDDWGDDDEDWGDDVSQEAVSKRMAELSSGIKSLAMDNDLEKTESERVDIFHNFVKAKIDDGSLDKSGKEIMTEADRLEIANKATIVLCELLFNESMVAQIKKHKKLFLRFTNDNQKAQKYLMGGFEKTVELHKEKLLPRVAVILKTFFDEDIIDEEVILEWAKKVSKKYVSKDLSEQIHKKAEPFVTWLKEAEEESSDEDEEDVELTFDDRARADKLNEQKDDEDDKKDAADKKSSPAKEGNNKAAAEENKNGGAGDEDDEDVDIDDI